MNSPTLKIIWAICILQTILFSSCSTFWTTKNKQFDSLLKEKLGFEKIANGKDPIYSHVYLTNGDKIRLYQGHNFINNPSTSDKLKIWVEVKNGKVYKVEKIDTLMTDKRIIREEWIITNNGGELKFTTSDFQGKLIHFHGLVFAPRQRFGNYTDTSVDSLGNAFTEWGVTGETPGIRRRN